ncbi:MULTISPECIES: DUF4255 domain-containing protein [unclassified Geodermatophilus]|uniref:DUF4255 domain-containing protein n=1 Tax=unclassified Geodermatophilus TaxID=2637632 RepID=UPI003EEE2289
MSASTAIGMVSSSLRAMLMAQMRLNLTVDVTVLAPDEQAGDRRVNLFLYRLEENAYLRNQEATVSPSDPGRLVPPPLSLVLYYLLTAYAPNDAETGNATAHQILGEAMRVFHDNPVVPDAHLDPGLRDAREDLQVVGKALDLEQLSQIWSTFSRPFRPSVQYQVSTVQLDARRHEGLRTPARVRRVAVPVVRTYPGPPVVDAMSPVRGPAGSAVDFAGEHLAGWRVGVVMGGRVVLRDHDLTGDAFTVPVPPDVAAGVYDLRVDVAGVFRRTFLFEVTS